jgi:hypothetical protein
VKNLTSVKEVDGLSADILLSIVGDIGDFADEGKLAAYFGIVRRISNSNQTERFGRITKRGTRLGRTRLAQCALIAQPYNTGLKNYYERKKSRGTGKAIIAQARKFLGIIYQTLRNKWMFEDFPNFVPAETGRHDPEHGSIVFATLSLASLQLRRLIDRSGREADSRRCCTRPVCQRLHQRSADPPMQMRLRRTIGSKTNRSVRDALP